MKLKPIVLTLSLLTLVACASFSTNLFRSEQLATNAGLAAYAGYTNALASGTIHITDAQSNSVKQARLKFTASVLTLENWRVQYDTNSSVKPFAQAALLTVQQDVSNLTWVVNLLTHH